MSNLETSIILPYKNNLFKSAHSLFYTPEASLRKYGDCGWKVKFWQSAHSSLLDAL